MNDTKRITLKPVWVLFGLNILDIFNLYIYPTTLWFRIFGYGLWFSYRKKDEPLLFSERYRIQCVVIGRFIIKLLTPSKNRINYDD